MGRAYARCGDRCRRACGSADYGDGPQKDGRQVNYCEDKRKDSGNSTAGYRRSAGAGHRHVHDDDLEYDDPRYHRRYHWHCTADLPDPCGKGTEVKGMGTF